MSGLSAPRGDAPAVVAKARITCPECGFFQDETMPTDSCRYLYRCAGCGKTVRPKPGDCCVFCSYADTVCPPREAGG